MARITTPVRASAPLALVCLMAVPFSAEPAGAQDVPDVARGDSWKTDFSEHAVPFEEIRSGGPPKDGIPAIDDPSFVSVGSADEWVDDREPVAVVSRGGDRGPVRRAGAGVRAGPGAALGAGEAAASGHARAVVETGHDRPYGRNPYAGYDTRSNPIERFVSGDTDSRLPPMERVVGLELGGESVAVPFSALEEERVAHLEVGDREVVVFWTPGTASALDAEQIARGPGVGSSNVFDPAVDGRTFWFAWIAFQPEPGVWEP